MGASTGAGAAAGEREWLSFSAAAAEARRGSPCKGLLRSRPALRGSNRWPEPLKLHALVGSPDMASPSARTIPIAGACVAY